MRSWLKTAKSKEIHVLLMVRPLAMAEYAGALQELKTNGLKLPSWDKLKMQLVPEAVMSITANVLKKEARKIIKPLAGKRKAGATTSNAEAGATTSNAEAGATASNAEVTVSATGTAAYVKDMAAKSISLLCMGRVGLIEDPVVAKAALANFYSLKFRREGERLQAITDMLDTEWYKVKKNTSGRSEYHDIYCQLRDEDAKRKKEDVFAGEPAVRSIEREVKMRLCLQTIADIDGVGSNAKQALEDLEEQPAWPKVILLPSPGFPAAQRSRLLWVSRGDASQTRSSH